MNEPSRTALDHGTPPGPAAAAATLPLRGGASAAEAGGARTPALWLRLGEALGLPAHYEALDAVLCEQFGCERWLNCLSGDDGLPVAVAAGEGGARPGERVVRLLAPGEGDERRRLAGVDLEARPSGVWRLPETARPYDHAVAYRFRHRPFGVLLVGGADLSAESLAELSAFVAGQFAPLCFREHTIEQVFQDKALFSAQLDYLHEMGKLVSDLDLKVLLNKIMELTMEFAGAEVGSLVLLEDNQPVTKLDWGLPHEALMALTDPAGEPLVFQTIDRTEPLWCEQKQFRVPENLPYRFERVALLPLRTRDSWLGLVCLVTSTENPEFTAAKLDGLGAGLSLAAIALENARLFQVKLERERELRNMEIAHDIQQALLPRTIPDLQGIGVVGTNIAARMIGGDYYDFFPFADGSLGIIVADVAGKGVAASLIMTSTRMLVRSIASHDVPVAEVMRRTNQLLQAEACGGQFVTANYVRIDPQRLVMEVCTAGHEPTLVYRPREDRFLAAQSRALPLGITPDAAYATETIPLEPGDLVVLYTDGINEAMNTEREQFGLARLQETIRAACPDGIEAVMRTVLTAVDWHSAGMPRHDDTTIVVAQVRPEPDTTGKGGVVADNVQP